MCYSNWLIILQSNIYIYKLEIVALKTWILYLNNCIFLNLLDIYKILILNRISKLSFSMLEIKKNE